MTKLALIVILMASNMAFAATAEVNKQDVMDCLQRYNVPADDKRANDFTEANKSEFCTALRRDVQDIAIKDLPKYSPDEQWREFHLMLFDRVSKIYAELNKRPNKFFLMEESFSQQSFAAKKIPRLSPKFKAELARILAESHTQAESVQTHTAKVTDSKKSSARSLQRYDDEYLEQQSKLYDSLGAQTLAPMTREYLQRQAEMSAAGSL